ncbi:hypothetical protein BDV25DRAFT_144716 [Aspergillus avenaceus]|uniref:Uncharacterized protein n=1 Tax=Aspergillus avenaceus TaxID=36643 RepID=A0A5N6TGB6_ASPAV|nr:hypothetical protein BDV25DRAFT_144716 [Aspergillus avenaceus]
MQLVRRPNRVYNWVSVELRVVLKAPVRGGSGSSLFACFPLRESRPEAPLFLASASAPTFLVAVLFAAQIANTDTVHDRLTVAIQRSPQICHQLVPTSWRDFSHNSLYPPPRSPSFQPENFHLS